MSDNDSCGEEVAHILENGKYYMSVIKEESTSVSSTSFSHSSTTESGEAIKEEYQVVDCTTRTTTVAEMFEFDNETVKFEEKCVEVKKEFMEFKEEYVELDTNNLATSSLIRARRAESPSGASYEIVPMRADRQLSGLPLRIKCLLQFGIVALMLSVIFNVVVLLRKVGD
ncbi:hypothetical protein KR093_000195 [Drosophila rubida]|uniref:Uncharacterized protein n=1 Tax=Drosophila rubida TaxID=30044 RepID=A0AAD4JX67_9MUSC|nr:hypothetical protein KR093_000195 [Drosophila rubida]